ncbi:leucine-rich repeat-containing protein 43-like isoform X1 [Syngnathus acus]|uniref:leucine-rich repeat-containing protein 43-like isoform X1 n=1 Tax=Syngnathus acus TaxID=161584 RepID=UPI001885C108|nr:leucine-rich repeat-containing protein 43-like isoform X1 [Syngnathus acus]
MSSVALSAVLDKHIRRLCLDQFPCGKGSWRKDGGSEAEAVTEDTDALLDLLNCPHSPWHHDEPWSPQAAALQRVAVVEPERLDADFVCSYFRKLRIVDKDVSVVDNYLLKFCNLQELVLSANRISEISAENLPRTLKVLELRANQLCALGRLAISPPPRLQYLGLAANRLGSHRDVTLLTGKQWPELVCLDLSECDFREQRPLLKALGTLPCLRTLVLEGNPFTLAPSYPGFAVNALPRLSYLDAAWIAPEERHRYRGMANMSHLLVDWASATVRVGVMQGVPDPQDEDPDAPEFPVVSYSYVISYMFFSHQTTAYREVVIGGPAKRQSQDQGAEPTQSLNKKSVKEIVVVNLADCDEDQTSSSCESRYSTSSQPWADCVDFGHVLTFVVRDLSGFKKFLHRGFFIYIEQEKILSWPAEVLDDSGQGATDKKGKKVSFIILVEQVQKAQDYKRQAKEICGGVGGGPACDHGGGILARVPARPFRRKSKSGHPLQLWLNAQRCSGGRSFRYGRERERGQQIQGRFQEERKPCWIQETWQRDAARGERRRHAEPARDGHGGAERGAEKVAPHLRGVAAGARQLLRQDAL